ncbi:hypothetical protein [Clostridium akagii]|uniref:hypothetical protein n=1 Tax=Clostridium akagii TaxID=91623 RepID=UPI00047A9326|nr:hypothetical protein [Clostridium akagii]
MNVDKAIKKQTSRYKRFVLAICLLFIVLPVILYISRQTNLFFIIYLFVIEMLILLFLVFMKNNQVLDYKVDAYKISITIGFPIKTINLPCEKVELVHAEGSGKDIKLVLIGKSKLRNKYVRPIDIEFLKENPYAGYYYGKLKKRNPETQYFYTIISRGGYKKYPLLNEIYRSCTALSFTEEAISRIKEYRNIIE